MDFEYDMVECPTCHKDWYQRRIIRLTAEETKKRKQSERSDIFLKFWVLLTLLAGVLTTVATFGFAFIKLFLNSEYPFIYSALLAVFPLAIMTLVYIFLLSRFKSYKTRQEIFKAHNVTDATGDVVVFYQDGKALA